MPTPNGCQSVYVEGGWYASSPASTRMGSRFCAGGVGQVVKALKPHGGFTARLKSTTGASVLGRWRGQKTRRAIGPPLRSYRPT